MFQIGKRISLNSIKSEPSDSSNRRCNRVSYKKEDISLVRDSCNIASSNPRTDGLTLIYLEMDSRICGELKIGSCMIYNSISKILVER